MIANKIVCKGYNENLPKGFLCCAIRNSLSCA